MAEGSRDWRAVCNSRGEGAFQSDVLQKKASEGEGACSPTEARRPHLPLRGKLGWMTPRAGWKQPENGMHPHFSQLGNRHFVTRPISAESKTQRAHP
jgi:hypothetical protein